MDALGSRRLRLAAAPLLLGIALVHCAIGGLATQKVGDTSTARAGLLGEHGAIELVQVLPDVDPEADRARILAEPVASPYETSNRYLVNFDLDLRNISGRALELRQMRYAWFDAAHHPLASTIVPSNQIAGLLIHQGSEWSFPEEGLLVGESWDSFVAQAAALEARGLRLLDLERYRDAGVVRFAGVFGPASPRWMTWVGEDWNGFVAKWQEFEADGLRLVDVEAFRDGNGMRYAGAFHEGDYARALWLANGWTAFVEKWEELESQGLRLVDVETIHDGSARRYVGVFHAGSYGRALWLAGDWASFVEKTHQLEGEGLRLVDVETFLDGSVRKYVGVFHEGSFRRALWLAKGWDGFAARKQELERIGLRLVDLETFAHPEGRHYVGVFHEGPPVLWPPDERLLLLSPQGELAAPPASVRVTLDFADAVDSVVIELPIELYRNRTAGGRLAFPASSLDLPAGRHWDIGSGHEGPRPWLPAGADHHRYGLHGSSGPGSYRKSQFFAHDLGVVEWNGSEWSGCDPTRGGSPTACDANEDALAWGVPVRAADDGTVLFCRRMVADNVPGGPKGSGGGNEFWMLHTNGVVALYAHMQQGSIPASLCTAGAQVRRGEILGRVGNSGASDGPHLHFHVQERAPSGFWHDYANGLPALFDRIAVRGRRSPPGAAWLPADDMGLVSNVVIRLPEPLFAPPAPPLGGAVLRR